MHGVSATHLQVSADLISLNKKGQGMSAACTTKSETAAKGDSKDDTAPMTIKRAWAAFVETVEEKGKEPGESFIKMWNGVPKEAVRCRSEMLYLRFMLHVFNLHLLSTSSKMRQGTSEETQGQLSCKLKQGSTAD